MNAEVKGPVSPCVDTVHKICRIDPAGPSVVFLSRPVTGVFKFEK